MNKLEKQHNQNKSGKSNIFSILKPYRSRIVLLVFFALAGNGVNLLIPRIISHGIDSFEGGEFIWSTIVVEFMAASLAIFLFSLMQYFVQVYTSERVAFDLRRKLSKKISGQSFSFVQRSNPSKLLTNLTSDMDSVKMFVSQAVATIASSVFIIIGACILLLLIDWKLALPVITMIPLIAMAFYIVLRKVKVLFRRTREIIDWLNKVINESIFGSAIIRVVNSQNLEYRKFMSANTEAKNLGISIVTLFAILIPVITFVSNLATLTILALGGHFVIGGSLSLGDFAAFNSYVTLLVFPIIIIGFMSNVIAQASASYERISAVLSVPEQPATGRRTEFLRGRIELKNVSVLYNGKPALKEASMIFEAGSQTAVIGPTAAGKSQLLYLLTGLINPDSGSVLFDGHPFGTYDRESFHKQIGLVFQDSVMFNLSLRENIAFNDSVTDELLEKAIETAELTEFINTLPRKLDTVVSERGTSLSGGQKQRIMLARALALDPKILLLDDFTARVDQRTEDRILGNIRKNYSDLTLISVTQKISRIRHFDQIILLMEAEVIATGKHKKLLESCPEYVQIYNSQRSTQHYELQS